ncbi:hypothetical protein EXIGLDRAFT_775726 [Exidia glandulosa HHB12029]|uniref:Uncharacterized protein n=1 Tax=Exidia glandulosa HHB12029 TaxID=1314781 RepID=A0A165BHB6_EXIGL|nr:hypothetical protein EXIGLDRAFT_780688 [Exidia glandulosa HHB12029]KZV85300.1 hypothetical protein EXIGLDRAFT_775726 [Exidia glandulosa HHB12029]
MPWGYRSSEDTHDRDAPRAAVDFISSRCRYLSSIATATHSLLSGEPLLQLSAAYSKSTSTLTRIHLRGPGVGYLVRFQDVIEMLGFFAHEPVEELSLSNYYSPDRPVRDSPPKPFPRLRILSIAACTFRAESMRILLLGLDAPLTCLRIYGDLEMFTMDEAIEIARALPLEELTVLHPRRVRARSFEELRTFTVASHASVNMHLEPPPNIVTLRFEDCEFPSEPFLWVRLVLHLLRAAYLPRCPCLRRFEARIPVFSVRNWQSAAYCLAMLLPQLETFIEVQLVGKAPSSPATLMQQVSHMFRVRQ